MKQLSKIQTIVLLVGGALMVVGAGMMVTGFVSVAPWVFLCGALLFAAMQLQQRYEGNNFVVRRLRRIMILADVFFVLAGLVMAESAFGFIRPWFLQHVENGSINYITYIYNKWVVLLLVAALLEVYTTHRISNELEKEAKKR
ncbi:MAG: hypothetical protein IJ928_06310 [Prevotella sp.]|nr:hypothetical protein [Prevotella sp.]